MNISQAAKVTGLSHKTLRFYEQQGIIRPVRRRDNGYRSYDEQQVEQLKFIKRVRNLGFSLEEARTLLGLIQGSACSASQVKAMVETQMRALDAQINALTRQRDALAALAGSCSGEGDVCPILETLGGESDPIFNV